MSLNLKIKQSSNQITLTGFRNDIIYDLQGKTLPQLNDYSFAVWHALPFAMRTQQKITIDGPVDPIVLENAERVMRAWELWSPSEFGLVEIKASSLDVPQATSLPPITFYSGGIDSTDMLLRSGKQQETADVVTVQGMDYHYGEGDLHFKRLVESTQPLLDSLNYRRIILRTNASEVASGYHAWGLALAGHAFLLSGMYGRANLAADYTWVQDMVSHPWGLNHVTNRLFKGTHFSVAMQCESVSRTEKVAEIAKSNIAIKATSFCKRRDVRPRNCGQCSKCIRTKAMFAVMCGEQPDIFIDRTFGEREINSIDLRARVERAFFTDLYQHARDKGMLQAYPAIERRFTAEIVKGKRPSILSTITRKIRRIR